MEEQNKLSLKTAIMHTLNAYSAEQDSDTPDFILANYLMGCLENWNLATKAREKWYGRLGTPVSPQPEAPEQP